jgi:hypothetical protein
LRAARPRRTLRSAERRLRAAAPRRPPPRVPDAVLRELAAQSTSRRDLWARFLRAAEAQDVAEIGVYRGRFSAHVLEDCPAIRSYAMIDPWRPLDAWDKPANVDRSAFDRLHRDAMNATRPWAAKRVVLRGTTSEVVDQIPDGSLDFAYVDGDHTLRGITIDLVKLFPKIRDGGWIGGDDFAPSIWQHGEEYEPTLVFPFAVHFAEAVGARIHALPRNQFLIEKRRGGAFELVDLTGRYAEVALKGQVAPPAPSQPPARS